MKHLLLLLLFCCFGNTLSAQRALPVKYVLVVHGGAGYMEQGNFTPEKEKRYREALQRALDSGKRILERGGAALDAVQAAIVVLEDDSLFNAGKGAVFTSEGKNELDASLMDGHTLNAGAVAGITTIKNPITAARVVMDKSRHVMMAGKGAEDFAAMNGCTVVDPSYFHTQHSWQTLQKAREADSIQKLKGKKSFYRPERTDHKFGTVGAVALDLHGHLAAGTSTGGMTNKKFGRIGDSPLIGCGTYANDNTCAVSCTGWGEYFIRLVMAKSVSDRMELACMTLREAAEEMILKKLPELGGNGGLIAVDKEGNIAMPFNTSGMFRAYIRSDGEKEIRIFGDR